MQLSLMPRGSAKHNHLGRYFTGDPCVRGHIAERRTSDGACVACVCNTQILRAVITLYDERTSPDVKPPEFWEWLNAQCTHEERALINLTRSKGVAVSRCDRVAQKYGGWPGLGLPAGS